MVKMQCIHNGMLCSPFIFDVSIYIFELISTILHFVFSLTNVFFNSPCFIFLLYKLNIHVSF